MNLYVLHPEGDHNEKRKIYSYFDKNLLKMNLIILIIEFGIVVVLLVSAENGNTMRVLREIGKTKFDS
jgi:hypothetical protein